MLCKCLEFEGVITHAFSCVIHFNLKKMMDRDKKEGKCKNTHRNSPILGKNGPFERVCIIPRSKKPRNGSSKTGNEGHGTTQNVEKMQKKWAQSIRPLTKVKKALGEGIDRHHGEDQQVIKESQVMEDGMPA